MSVADGSDEIIPKTFGQNYVIQFCRVGEQRSYFGIVETGYAAADACHKKCQRRVLFGISDEIVDIRLYGFRRALHCGYGVALSL